MHQNYKEVSAHTGQNGHCQKVYKQINAGESVKRKEPSHTVGGNVNWYSYYGEQYGGSLKLKLELPYDPANPTPGHISRENYDSKRYMHPNVHCSTIYKSQDMKAI